MLFQLRLKIEEALAKCLSQGFKFSLVHNFWHTFGARPLRGLENFNTFWRPVFEGNSVAHEFSVYIADTPVIGDSMCLQISYILLRFETARAHCSDYSDIVLTGAPYLLRWKYKSLYSVGVMVTVNSFYRAAWNADAV